MFYNNLFKSYEYNKTVSGLVNELRTIYVYNLFEKENKNIIFVTSSIYEANNFYQSFLAYTNNVLLFPMDDFLTSEALAVSPELKTKRLETINSLVKDNSKKIVITNLMGYRRFLPSKNLYKSKIINLKKGMEYNFSNLVKDLFNIGYIKESIITKTGEIGVRGFVLDIFPIESLNPIRIEFWGDQIDTIKYFDIDSQRSTSEIEEISIYPNNEFLTNKEVEFNLMKQNNLNLYEDVVSIKDYISSPLMIFNDYSQLLVSNSNIDEEIMEYNASLGLKTKKYMFDFTEIKLNDYIYFEDFNNNSEICFNSRDLLPFDLKKDEINKRLNTYLKEKRKVIICASSIYKIDKIENFLENEKILRTSLDNIKDGYINVIVFNLNKGFEFNDYIVISESELFNTKDKLNKFKTSFKMGSKIKDITKLEVGDYIVHSAYGIGRYLGIKTLNKNGVNKDYLQIEYKGDDKLYIPVEKIDQISKYSSNDGIPRVNSLNSTEWEKTKQKVKKRIENIAGDLLKLYAERESAKGFAFLKDDENQINFEKDFNYLETNDQIKVTDEIKKDMESDRPMDRLLCGDVGYGKTEVAFRAIFKAVLSGKQVAFLCPTTILSQQHYKNAIQRFKNFAVNIQILNRFVTEKETKKILSDLKDGKIDVLIGTHRILSDDVIFKNLGLLVIDEEQRFGVKHKEKIKQFKNNIDVLTLTATPIPRTLQMSMSGVRSLSLIETPPVNRYPVQTYVLGYNKQIIKDAIYKELSRDGQIFILHNKIDEIELLKNEVQSLVPDAKISIAHGRMDKDSIENVMMNFINKKFDILMCTTIIETGIDIPNVNTLIILDADHFGLSQLYQIRGRVGRGDRIAYCYLMYDQTKILSEVAVKRLKVIKDFTELGSGFAIAMRDLSIRGAGDFLGSEQSGFIDSVGIDLFMQLLNEEICRLKGEPIKEKDESINTLIDVETSIKNDYVSDEDLKIYIHKKINEIDSYDKLAIIKSEIEDRFGKVDENMDIYMHEELFEKMARSLGLNRIHQTKNFIEIILTKEMTSQIHVDVVFEELMKYKNIRFANRFNQLVIILDTVKLDKHFIYYLIYIVEAIKKGMEV